MTKREELISLSGQVVNGMMSADGDVWSKLIDRAVLIPMSEMTEEHKKELEEIKSKYADDVILLADNIKRFFLKNHYDDRNLLERGLAVLSL